MKIVILADKSYNYVRPIADGLYNAIVDEGHDVKIYYDGLYWLDKLNLFKILLIDIIKFFKNLGHRKRKIYQYRFLNLLFFTKRNKQDILNSDCIIVVANCPSVFYKDKLKRIEELRKIYSGPIVNYDLHYLPNQGWYSMFKRKNKLNFGLERFDWYLPASIVTEYALSDRIPLIYSNIGFDIRSDDLYPQQNEFIALLDFPRTGYEKERALQVRALKETNTPFIELKEKLNTKEIRNIYRKISLYFVSSRESFGLPVLEIQLCGGMIATPFASWLPAHFLDKNIHEAGNGRLGSNFIMYENNLELLKDKITYTKNCFNSTKNKNNFINEYPDYYRINKVKMKDFIVRISNKEITNMSHLEYKKYNEYISLDEVKI